MRGKGRALDIVKKGQGITPAYAGKRAPDTSSRLEGQDHPRVCGEKLWRRWRRTWQRGSPPRMRGKGVQPQLSVQHTGITPAYAGKSSLDEIRQQRTRDHPRVCGEKSSNWEPLKPRMGSPPRMRGKEHGCYGKCMFPGITPAYAGKR